MKNASDEALIELYRGGDINAMGEIINRYYKSLKTFVYAKTRNHSLTEDILQETFIKVVIVLREKNSNYSEQGKLYYWIKRIADNLIIDHSRNTTKRHSVLIAECDLEDFENLLESTGENHTSVEDKLVKSQIYEDLYKLIKSLPENQQEIIRLHFFYGLSYKEIADETDNNINTALGRTRYALKNLRRMIKDNNINLIR